MPSINVLPKHIADLIAAGEVVERPSSVIKELMENAIDAGADSITVEIRHGGVTYLRVTDNGCGIAREDIRNAFKSHATSKILTEEDLLSIGTLGFRGEALASIAAVSKVDLLTRTPDESIGTVYKIEGSEEILLDDAGCPLGTTIVVRDLFYNTPARMKFLKRDVTEGNSVAGVVDRIALSHPEVSVRFIRDDRQQLATSGNGKLDSTVYSVFGKDFAGGLLETEYELNGVKVSGLVSKPTASRANRSMQFFFLNGRLVKSRTACAALEQAYKGAIMVGRFPSCVLNITLPLETVDVNVHPAKTEVRFSDEKKVFDAVYYAAKNAIELKDTPNRLEVAKQDRKAQKNPFHGTGGEQIRMDSPDKTGDKSSFRKTELPEKVEGFWSKELPKEYRKDPGSVHRTKKKPGPNPETPRENPAKPPKPYVPKSARTLGAVVREGEKKTVSTYLPFPEETSPVTEETKAPVPEEKTTPVVEKPEMEPEIPPLPEEAPPEPERPKASLDIPFEETEPSPEEPKNAPENDEEAPVPYAEQTEVPEFRIIGEAFETYLIFESGGKLTLVDKHAAHERILYEELLAGRGAVQSQVLLTPLTITVSKEEYAALLDHADMLEQAGFLVEDFGSGTVVLREVPVMLVGYDLKAILEEMAGHLLEEQEPLPEKLKWIYANTACRAAIKAGDHTPPEEQRRLVEYLLSHRDIRYCPHGRPICIEMTRTDLEKGFGRIQK